MVNKFLIGYPDLGCDRSCFHFQWRDAIVFVIYFQRDLSSPFPMIVAPVKCGLMFTVKIISPEDGLMQIIKRLRRPDRYVAINAVIFFEIDPEFQYSHNQNYDFRITIYELTNPHFADQSQVKL